MTKISEPITLRKTVATLIQALSEDEREQLREAP